MHHHDAHALAFKFYLAPKFRESYSCDYLSIWISKKMLKDIFTNESIESLSIHSHIKGIHLILELYGTLYRIRWLILQYRNDYLTYSIREYRS